MVSDRQLNVLKIISERLMECDIPWVITGSLGMALQGVPLEVHDIDIQVCGEDTFAIEHLLLEFSTKPVSFSGTDQIKSYLGRFVVAGIQVEVMGGLQKKLPGETWEPPVDVTRYRHYIIAGNMLLPVLSLAYEQEAYRILGRKPRVRLLEDWLAAHPNPVEIVSLPVEMLRYYANIPISFWVKEVYRAEVIQEEGFPGGIHLAPEGVDPPYLKDYDHSGAEEDSPRDWPRLFNIVNWGIFLARAGNQPVGGAAVAFKTAGITMLEGRTDLAVLWDIRIHPDWRGRGIGTRLFQVAAAWARERGCKQLKVETQNVNAAACRFYVRMGCELGSIRRFAYAAQPCVAHEVMLEWYLNL